MSCANTPNTFNKITKFKEGQVKDEVSIKTDVLMTSQEIEQLLHRIQECVIAAYSDSNKCANHTEQLGYQGLQRQMILQTQKCTAMYRLRTPLRPSMLLTIVMIRRTSI